MRPRYRLLFRSIGVAFATGLVAVGGCSRGGNGTPRDAAPESARDATAADPAPAHQPAQDKTASTQPVEARAADDGPMQPADAVSAEDLKVLDAALSHMAADAEFEPEYSGRRIVVHSSTFGGSAFVRRGQVLTEAREGKLPEDALRDLESRNNGPLVQVSGMTFSSVQRAGAALGAWAPTNSNVTLDDLDRFPSKRLSLEFEEALKKAHPDAKAYVRVGLPGYSTDRRQAVVRLAFGPSAHGAMATYLLTKDAAGSWTVTWRKFGYYA